MAIGTKSCVCSNAAYFKTLFSAALSAALAAEIDERLAYEDARLSTTVTSHARHLPEDQGICVTPSGRLPSERIRPDGSLEEGTPAVIKLRCMISLSALCL